MGHEDNKDKLVSLGRWEIVGRNIKWSTDKKGLIIENHNSFHSRQGPPITQATGSRRLH